MDSSIVVQRPDVTALAALAGPLVAQAQALTVTDVESHGLALQALQGLSSLEKKIAEHYEPTRKALDTAKKELLAARDSMLAPVETARQIVGRKCDTFEAEQRRIAAEAQRQAEAEARKREEERAIQEAIEAEEAGDTEQADEILDAPVEVPMIRVAPEVAKVAGVSSRQTWHAEVVDLPALIRFVAARPEWLQLLIPNMPALNGLARSQQSALAIPGVLAYSETSRSVRTA